jgi:hypothetical protein
MPTTQVFQAHALDIDEHRTGTEFSITFITRRWWIKE